MVRRVDVAERAGVTPAVVSYVTNNSHPVAPETRRRVLEAIDALGYRPNAVARALATSRTQTVGLIVPNLENPFFAELAYALEAAAFSSGYTVLVGNASEEDRHALDYVRVFADRRVDGLVVAPITGDAKEVVAQASSRQIPVVFTDRGIGVHGPTVLTDNVAGARQAAEHLLQHGRSIHACITGPDTAAPSVDRVRGWVEGLTAAGAVADPALIDFQPFTAEAAYDATIRLLEFRPDIDSILVGSDIQATGVLRALHDIRRMPGYDISVIAYDGTSGADFTHPRLTTVSQPITEMATAIIELLAGLIAPHEEGAECGIVRMLPTKLVIRESCGCNPRIHQPGGDSPAGKLSIPHEGVR